MIITPKNIQYTGGKTYLSEKISVNMCEKINTDYVCELWRNFTYNKSELIINSVKDYVFGNKSNFDANEYDYVLTVDENINISAKSEKDLMHGIYTLTDMIEYDENGIYISNCRVLDTAATDVRTVHICVMPETEFSLIKRTIKYCAFLKYTHIIIEFWGMLKFDCMKELSWENGWSKNQVRELCALAEKCKIELVPMFNHLGHAAQSRLCSGKHVVLDQNMQYYDLFEPDGWVWNIKNQKTLDLLGKIRRELCEIFDKNEYFHIGCDEAFIYGKDEKLALFFADYVNNVAADLKKLGKRAIMWGDMLQHRGAHANDGNSYEFYSDTEKIAENVRENLSKDIIIADWQYSAKKYPVNSALFLKERGFDVLACPFFDNENVRANVQTAVRGKLFGVMCTTWDRLEKNLPYLAVSANDCLNGNDTEGEIDGIKVYTDNFAKVASLIRKLDFSYGDYTRAGWMKKQITD